SSDSQLTSRNTPPEGLSNWRQALMRNSNHARTLRATLMVASGSAPNLRAPLYPGRLRAAHHRSDVPQACGLPDINLTIHANRENKLAARALLPKSGPNAQIALQQVS